MHVTLWGALVCGLAGVVLLTYGCLVEPAQFQVEHLALDAADWTSILGGKSAVRLLDMLQMRPGKALSACCGKDLSLSDLHGTKESVA